MTVGPIETFMVADHARVDRLLEQALSGAEINLEAYETFRHDLLRHIAMEEKVLLPDARARRDGVPLELASALRADHGAIAKLLVPSPTVPLIDSLCQLLARHNALEEGPNGLYALCDGLAKEDAHAVVARLQAMPSVPLAPHYDGPEHRRP